MDQPASHDGAPGPTDDLIRRLAELNQIGIALSQEKDLERLLEIILVAAKKITNADGTKTTASAGRGDPYEEYWEQMYALVGATARPFVPTSYARG